MSSPLLEGLGFAICWLRNRQSRKQFQVANAAGITKGMLSSYETGRQRPSLDTLEKILDALGCDLNDLHNALQLVNGRGEAMRPKSNDLPFPPFPLAGASEVVRSPVFRLEDVLGVTGPIPPEVESSLSQMVDGFHRFVRHLFVTFRQVSEA